MEQNRWFILAPLFLARTALGFQFHSVGSSGPMLVDHARAGCRAAGPPHGPCRLAAGWAAVRVVGASVGVLSCGGVRGSASTGRIFCARSWRMGNCANSTCTRGS